MVNLSVIVPIYNVENYLRKCIDSILSQTYRDFELILVDDGSTDTSNIICDEYASKDDRIVIIHKENGGLSDARNKGIAIAKGKYIAFVDGDDFILNNSYDLMIDEAEKNDLDIIVGYALTYYDKGNTTNKIKKRSFENKVYSGGDFLSMSINSQCMSMCVFLNIYRANLIKNNSLFFKKGILHEDELWTPQVFLKAKSVKYIDVDFYMHVNREGSITNNKSPKFKNAVDIINTCYELENVYSGIEKVKRKILNSYLLDIYLYAFYIGKLTQNPLIRKSFVINKAITFKKQIHAFLFIVNKSLYYNIINMRYRRC